jgi:catechol 2,3-dioxygenase-like lactoylglutathione lyase family enzyme
MKTGRRERAGRGSLVSRFSRSFEFPASAGANFCTKATLAGMATKGNRDILDFSRDGPWRRAMTDVPASRLTASAPVLLVSDVVAAANHYRDTMGFGYDEFFGDPANFVILGRDGMYLMLKQVTARAQIVPHNRVVPESLWDAYFWVSDADGLYADFVKRGATIDYEPCDQFYGCREFAIRDPDGYSIGFGQVVGSGRD